MTIKIFRSAGIFWAVISAAADFLWLLEFLGTWFGVVVAVVGPFVILQFGKDD